ncbi:hypothetical protein DVDV_1424 [Desulfovibrio sp. DV]|nr:hypothetical protein DVDV_1424 [Desulfovibrio sp. DV]
MDIVGSHEFPPCLGLCVASGGPCRERGRPGQRYSASGCNNVIIVLA